MNTNLSDLLDPDENYYETHLNSCSMEPTSYLSIPEYNDICNETKNYFSLINYNIRSFRQNSDNFISIFQFNCLPHCFVLTETWFTENYTDK